MSNSKRALATLGVTPCTYWHLSHGDVARGFEFSKTRSTALRSNLFALKGFNLAWVQIVSLRKLIFGRRRSYLAWKGSLVERSISRKMTTLAATNPNLWAAICAQRRGKSGKEGAYPKYGMTASYYCWTGRSAVERIVVCPALSVGFIIFY